MHRGCMRAQHLQAGRTMGNGPLVQVCHVCQHLSASLQAPGVQLKPFGSCQLVEIPVTVEVSGL